MAQKHVTKWFLRSAGLILLITGICKLVSIAGEAKILAADDPLLHLRYRPLLLIVALIELSVATVLFSKWEEPAKFYSLIWLSGCFLIYRFSLWLLHPAALCPCLGSLTEMIPISPRLINAFLEVAVAYLFLGSIFMFKVYPRIYSTKPM